MKRLSMGFGRGRGREGRWLQEASQRLSLLLPACTMRTMELTIIERASLAAVRPSSSETSTRSGPDVLILEA